MRRPRVPSLRSAWRRRGDGAARRARPAHARAAVRRAPAVAPRAARAAVDDPAARVGPHAVRAALAALGGVMSDLAQLLGVIQATEPSAGELKKLLSHLQANEET